MSGIATWRVVWSRELRDLWIGGKALYLILIYTVLLGIYAYLFASNSELRLLPLKQMMVEIVKASIAVGLFISLVIGADSVSGERERATLEGLLLTPTSRRQIVLGKFLAALSPWPVALALGIPYWVLLAKGDPVIGPALLWGPIVGCLLAPALTGLGMLVSLWCNSNKTSMLVSIGLYLVLILPAELTTPATGAGMRVREDLLQGLNPMAAGFRLVEEGLIRHPPLAELWSWAAIPALFAVLVLVALFAVAGPRLGLEAAAGAGRSDRGSPRDGVPEPTLPPWWGGPEFATELQREHPPAKTLARGPQPRVPAWWLIYGRELHELWVGGRALSLLLGYTVIVGGGSFLSVNNSQLDLIPPKEMVWSILQLSIYSGVFMGLIIGADSLSGARDRAVLEPLLLTPASRRQIAAGKLLAAVSPWPLALAVSVPCLVVLSQGDAILGPALLWSSLLGSLLVLGFTALGMLVSLWSNSNRTSFFVSLTCYLLLLLPALLPGQAQKGLVGKFFQRSNPLAATDEFLEKILVNNRTLHEFGSWLQSPVGFPILVIGLLLLYAGPRLRLEAGWASTSRPLGRDAMRATT